MMTGVKGAILVHFVKLARDITQREKTSYDKRTSWIPVI
jgi:hypothetical protein